VVDSLKIKNKNYTESFSPLSRLLIVTSVTLAASAISLCVLSSPF